MTRASPETTPPDTRLSGADDGAAAAAAGGQPYLDRLAERVRLARARRGMSRRQLARHSGVSERFLAQLESGKGNASVLTLRQVAQAMGVDPADLVREEKEPSVQLRLLGEFLARLSPDDLNRARSMLVAAFGPVSDGSRAQRIALVGLRGAGKSTLGRLLAERLGHAFVELDAEIAAASGLALGELLDGYGQAVYRAHERACLEKLVARGTRTVIATGGGIVSEPATYDLLLSSCFTVWVRARPEEHMGRVVAQGDLRPMAGHVEAMADLERILQSRAELYARADAVLDTAGLTVEASLAALLALLPEGPHSA